jgi:hypothetical protein
MERALRKPSSGEWAMFHLTYPIPGVASSERGRAPIGSGTIPISRFVDLQSAAKETPDGGGD